MSDTAAARLRRILLLIPSLADGGDHRVDDLASAIGTDRETLVRELMNARRAVKTALKSRNAGELQLARKAVDAAKIALGERGPVWWTDGAPDFNRHKVAGSPYEEWWASQRE